MKGLPTVDARSERRRSLLQSDQGRWAVGRLGSVVIIGLVLCLGLGSMVGSSHAQGTRRGGLKQRQSGNGPGVKVAHPPPLRPAASSVLRPGQTGYCHIPIRSSYDPDDWGQQKECLFVPSADTWLVTVTNNGNNRVPVLINEWYGASRHGQTILLPGETKLLPLWGHARVWMGACWLGAGGPGTCRAGSENSALVSIQNWLKRTLNHELWFRDYGSQSVPREEGDSVVATNESEFTIQLWWSHRKPDDYVTIPPKGRSEPVPFRGGVRTFIGKKDFGTRAAARVTFTKTGGVDEDTYTLVTPGNSGPGSPPVTTMTFLFGSWCSVRLENLGPTNSVVLNTWAFPGFPLGSQTGPGLSLAVGKSDTLSMKPGTVEITGQVGIGLPGSYTTLKATNWQKCP